MDLIIDNLVDLLLILSLPLILLLCFIKYKDISFLHKKESDSPKEKSGISEKKVDRKWFLK